MHRAKSLLFFSIPVAPLFAQATTPLPTREGQGGESSGGEFRPNIVYIMTDDHTAQMMSCYDTRFVETPNLDRIARDGVRFTHSYVANSLSGPSRACMLTGKHSHKNGFTNNEHGIFDGSQQTMPKLLQAAGYETCLIGKWHLVSTPTGFDHWEILPGQGDYYNPAFIHMDGTRSADSGYVTRIITDKALEWLEKRGPAPRSPRGGEGRKTSDVSVSTIGKEVLPPTGGDREGPPFALFIHHKACHRAWLPALEDLRLYEDRTFPLPLGFHDDYATREAAGKTEMEIGKDMDIVYDTKMFVSPKETPRTRLSGAYQGMIGRLSPEERKQYDDFYVPLSRQFYEKWGKDYNFLPRQAQSSIEGSGDAELLEWKYQRYMRDYAKVVHELDVQVGRVLDYLEEKGLLDNTLVVYTSDQGFYMGEHGWFDKRFMYEESLSTPLVMRLPKGYERRGDIDEMVQNIDYAPTFLDLAGAAIPEDIQGVSLLPLLKGKDATKQDKQAIRHWRDAIYYHYYEYPAEHDVRRHYGIRTDRYKLIHFYGHDVNAWELFDLKEDPREMHNLYGQPGMEKLQRQLHERLEALQIQYDDPQR
ncbi:MAG: sulfatase [Bacteroidaceae bacterium]|nr:sulfatase [Bacteroidaceae bacterium]